LGVFFLAAFFVLFFLAVFFAVTDSSVAAVETRRGVSAEGFSFLFFGEGSEAAVASAEEEATDAVVTVVVSVWACSDADTATSEIFRLELRRLLVLCTMCQSIQHEKQMGNKEARERAKPCWAIP
jgi:hypothetical protein